MPSRLSALLVAVVCALLLPQSAQASVTAGELDALVDRNLDALYAHRLPWGGFHDPLTGPQFNYGAVGLAWLAGERLPDRRAAAALTLRYGTAVKAPGAFQAWFEAETVNAAWLDGETRAVLADHLRAYVAPTVGPRAQPCQRRADCYNNLKLVDAVASLALVRTGLVSPVRGTRLADPAATERATRAFLDARVAAAQRPDLRITGGGVAAVLSDPSRNPLAYHALSTAILMRAVRLSGAPGARAAARRALWALVGLADPRGTVAWMGRGQENTWTYAASVYAALAGAAEFASEPALASRLRRLAELSFAELLARQGPTGFAVVPGPPRATLAGADKSQNTVVCNGLTLVFLHLAARRGGRRTDRSAPVRSGRLGGPRSDRRRGRRRPRLDHVVRRPPRGDPSTRRALRRRPAVGAGARRRRLAFRRRPAAEHRQREKAADRGTGPDPRRPDALAVWPPYGRRRNDRPVRRVARRRRTGSRDVALPRDRGRRRPADAVSVRLAPDHRVGVGRARTRSPWPLAARSHGALLGSGPGSAGGRRLRVGGARAPDRRDARDPLPRSCGDDRVARDLVEHPATFTGCSTRLPSTGRSGVRAYVDRAKRPM